MKRPCELFQEAWEEAIKDYDVGKYSKEIEQYMKIEQLEKENKRLREALEDIYQHSAKPFIGIQWNNYAHHVAFKALKRSTVQNTGE